MVMSGLAEFEIWGQTGWCGYDVVGESHHVDNIARLFTRVTQEGAEQGLPATLVHEPGNHHDANAVAVCIGGGQVGTLKWEDAARYAPVLAALQRHGRVAVTAARVWCRMEDEGWGRRVFGSVQLDLPEPPLMVPVNLPPSMAFRLVPRGNAIQVTGEENRLATLVRYRQPSGECWAYTTVHAISQRTARTEKTVVEVRIDGEPVGRLTPKMSEALLPTMAHCEDRGQLTAVRAMLKGNQVRMEVVLHVARAHEIPDGWFDEHQPQSSTTAVTVATPAAAPTPAMPPAAWYPNPAGAGLRWWDGARWTDHVHPGAR